MGCTSMSIPTSSPITTATTKDIFKEHTTTLRRSQSTKDLCDRAGMRRSRSDPQLRCSSSIRAAGATESKLKTSQSTGLFQFPFSSSILPSSVRSLLFDPVHPDKEMKYVQEQSEERVHDQGEEEVVENEQQKRANWIERLLELRSQWRKRQQNEKNEEHGDGEDDDDDEGCEVDYSSEFDEVTLDRETFSRLLAKVPWSDTKLYSKLAYLCNMAYVIPDIKEEDLQKYYNLHFVTSSLEKKAVAAFKAKLSLNQGSNLLSMPSSINSSSEKVVDTEPKRSIRPKAAYDIAASAATYIHSRAKGLLSLGYCPEFEGEDLEILGIGENLQANEGCLPSPSRVYKSEVAAYVAASTMTAVVAAEETAKLEAANELQSLHSSPCEWFICDDTSTYTRCFIIQGSDSLASWKANLFFEPTKFEGTDVLVHRGIYEAAKGIYEQFMPEILSHLVTYGDRAKLRFTGHSLGGSLSLLVNLMLLARGVVKPSSLLPVVTFGSPSIFCGGHRILDELGVDESHVHSVMMHRDIVPRAFSCNYPNHVAQVLKRLNGTFRSHPCLNNNKMLYTPLGQLFILQPDEKSSPAHPLLPPGTAMYSLDKTQCDCTQVGIKSALKAFLNTPHPLETLSDPTAYGSEGTILRDHDSSNYLKAMNGVLRQRTKLVVRRSRKERLHQLWPLLTTSQSPHSWRHHQQNLENPSLVTKEVVT